MSVTQETKSLYQGLLNNGNIRYVGLPLNGVPLPDDSSWVELFVAGAGPVVDYWLCGFSFSIATTLLAAEAQYVLEMGWGGADGAAVAAANVVVTGYPMNFTAAVAALGPAAIPTQILPIPVKIPAGSRMAASLQATPVGGTALLAFVAILATGLE